MPYVYVATNVTDDENMDFRRMSPGGFGCFHKSLLSLLSEMSGRRVKRMLCKWRWQLRRTHAGFLCRRSVCLTSIIEGRLTRFGRLIVSVAHDAANRRSSWSARVHRTITTQNNTTVCITRVEFVLPFSRSDFAHYHSGRSFPSCDRPTKSPMRTRHNVKSSTALLPAGIYRVSPDQRLDIVYNRRISRKPSSLAFGSFQKNARVPPTHVSNKNVGCSRVSVWTCAHVRVMRYSTDRLSVSFSGIGTSKMQREKSSTTRWHLSSDIKEKRLWYERITTPPH